jgi:hypothetical protein
MRDCTAAARSPLAAASGAPPEWRRRRRVDSPRQEVPMEAGGRQEFLALEKKFWNAMQRRDAAVAADLTDDACIIVGAQGVGLLDRATIGKMVENASYELQRYDLGRDVQVRRIADDVVIVAYQVHEELEVEGKATKLDAYDASVWVKRGDGWVCAMHTESIAGDPFGRDRK